ncbi:LuxR C-terminal-related transcriptional regulator [Streptacidiphilus sp. P02-A3a]|uniref:response regulator transcription factor n=1 Tax=Streptacidiphilus sp. P02-A3a TaxID=2704468 RepID=UPI0015FA4615|nr:LuxR C-terminal-related transcriptional regulator [Streptacidiphilus sp. P02-A3a]QMU71787.1 response regulator transcription factor [Streptacidiphilus sp. P02-A3a]
MGEPVKVSIVAQDPVLEAGTRSCLQYHGDIAVVLPGEPAQVAVMMVDRVTSRVIDAVRAAREADQRREIVLVATELAGGDAVQALAAGARGLLRRSEATAERLASTVVAAAVGDCTLPPDLLDGLLEHGHGADALRAGAGVAERAGASLSEREQAVLRLVADGRETVEIAHELCYSPRTVTSVVHDVTHRFQLRNRAHAVAFALRAGLL